MLKIYQLCKNQNTFEVTFKYKGVGVQVSFVDGNTYNGTPARCCTRDVFKQRAIEASQMFKEHEIILERTVKEESDRKTVAVRAMAKATRSTRIVPMPTPVVKNNTAASAPEPEPAPNPTPAPEPITTPVTEEPATQDKTDDSTEEDGDGAKEMNFDSLAAAIVFIAQTWDIEVQTENEARKVLKENGITPHIKR